MKLGAQPIDRYPVIHMLPQAQRGIARLAERAPQAEALGRRLLQRLRPAWDWLAAARRRLATFAVAGLTLWLFLHVMFGANGMVVYRQKRAEFRTLGQEIDRLQKENGRYTTQIEALQTNPETIEKEAREQLHYTRPGEVIYVAPPPVSGQNPPAKTARQ